MKRKTRIAFATIAAAGIVATASYAPVPAAANDNGAPPDGGAVFTPSPDTPPDRPA